MPPEKAAKKATTRHSRSTRRSRTDSASRPSNPSSRTCPSRCCTPSSTPRSTVSSSSAPRSASSTCSRSSRPSNRTCGNCASAAASWAARSSCTPCTRRWSCAAVSSTTSTTSSASACSWTRCATATPCWRPPRALDAAARALQGLHRHSEVQPVPVAAHDGARTRRPHGRDPDPHARDAPAGRVRRRGALEVQGADGGRQDGRQVGRCRHGMDRAHLGLAGRDRRPGGVPRLAAVRDRRERGLRLHAEGSRLGLPPVRRRSTSRTRCTPRSATARWAPRSTGAWCRWSRRCRAVTSSRCSRRRTPTPAPARTGSASSRAPARAARSAGGSRRNVAKRPSSRARTPSPARCAVRTCRCSA